MNILRRTSTIRLVIAVLVIAIVSGATAYAVSTRSGPKPPPRSLAAAIHSALAGKPVAGVTARIAFTNHLLQTGLPSGTSSPLLSGASGRLWAGGGRLRLELQASTGDTEIGYDGKSLTVYDVASNTAYVLAVHRPPARSAGAAHQVPSIADVKQALQPLLQHVALAGPVPANIGGQPAYTVRISPKHSAGLLGSVELGWDASHGVPLKVAVFSQGDSTPVLSLTATSISFGAVPASDLKVSMAPGAKVVHVTTPTHMAGPEVSHGGKPLPEVSGLKAVAHALSFPLSAPARLVGVPRRTVRLVQSSSSKGAMVVYGRGLGAILLVEQPLSGSDRSHSLLSSLPSVSVHGAAAHELATALGTAIQWDRGGVRYTLIGSLPAPAAEAAARAIG